MRAAADVVNDGDHRRRPGESRAARRQLVVGSRLDERRVFMSCTHPTLGVGMARLAVAHTCGAYKTRL